MSAWYLALLENTRWPCEHRGLEVIARLLLARWPCHYTFGTTSLRNEQPRRPVVQWDGVHMIAGAASILQVQGRYHIEFVTQKEREMEDGEGEGLPSNDQDMRMPATSRLCSLLLLLMKLEFALHLMTKPESVLLLPGSDSVKMKIYCQDLKKARKYQ